MKLLALVSFLLSVVGSGVAVGKVSHPADFGDMHGPFEVRGMVVACTAYSHVRLIEVRYLDEADHSHLNNGHVPCEVRYYKPTEHPTESYRVLWHAHKEKGYCERKAAWLVHRLERWRWSCTNPQPVYEPSNDDSDHGERCREHCRH